MCLFPGLLKKVMGEKQQQDVEQKERHDAPCVGYVRIGVEEVGTENGACFQCKARRHTDAKGKDHQGQDAMAQIEKAQHPDGAIQASNERRKAQVHSPVDDISFDWFASHGKRATHIVADETNKEHGGKQCHHAAPCCGYHTPSSEHMETFPYF